MSLLKSIHSPRQAARILEFGAEMFAHLVHVPLRGARYKGLERRRFFSQQTQVVARRKMKRMGFDIEIVGLDEKLMKEKNFLLVGNHMSYLDILLTSTALPIIFVTSVDMGEVPVLGRLAELGGSIFVERRNRSQVDRDLSNMTQALRDGFNVMIYPEGTSTNGLKLLPFKKSLLMAAVEAERDIMPVVLKYVSIDGEPFGPNNCDKVCWYGKMSFVPHFIQLMGLKKIKVRVEFLPPIKVTKDSSRNELAEKCFNAIHTAYFGYPPAHDSVGANQTSTVANASSSGSAAAAATTSSAVSAAGRDNSSMN